jgi:putative membrane protein
MKTTINHGGHFYTSQAGCLTRLMVLSIAVMVGAWLLKGIVVESFGAVLLTALVISFLNNILRPALIVIALPTTPITLGLLLFVLNTIVIILASDLVSGFHVDSLGTAALFSLVLMVVNYLLEIPNRLLNRQSLNPSDNQTAKESDDTDDEGFTPYEEIKD